MMVLTNVGKELVIAMDAWVLMTVCMHTWACVEYCGYTPTVANVFVVPNVMCLGCVCI